MRLLTPRDLGVTNHQAADTTGDLGITNRPTALVAEEA